MSHLDQELLTASAIDAEWQVSEFDVQVYSDTAWAFATLNQYMDGKLFTALARESKQRVVESNAEKLANTAWALAMVT